MSKWYFECAVSYDGSWLWTIRVKNRRTDEVAYSEAGHEPSMVEALAKSAARAFNARKTYGG